MPQRTSKELVVIKKVLAVCSLLIIVVFIGFVVSCEINPQDGFLETEVNRIFSAYSELMDTLDSEEENPGINHIYDSETEKLIKIEFDDVQVTIESETYIFNGSLDYSPDGSSILNLSISTGSVERAIEGDITVIIAFDEKDEIISFNINGDDHTEDFIEYWDSVTIVVTYYSSLHDSGSVPPPQTKLEGKPITIAGNTGSLSREGFTLSGWQQDNNGKIYSVGEEYVTDEDLELYAVWTEKPTYKITYSGNGNDSGEAPSAQTKLEGEPITIAGNTGSLSKDDYTFNGWKTASGTTYAVGYSYSADADLGLLANWEKDGFSVQDGYPVITGFTRSPKTVDTTRRGGDTYSEETSDEYYGKQIVTFTVSATADDPLWKAEVFYKYGTGADTYLARFDRESSNDQNGGSYSGSDSSGTFTLKMPISNLMPADTYNLYYIRVYSKNSSTQKDTVMNAASAIAEGYLESETQIINTHPDYGYY